MNFRVPEIVKGHAHLMLPLYASPTFSVAAKNGCDMAKA